jgi:hypothetical protein
MPENAEGTTTRKMVDTCPPPSAQPASRSDEGTACSASSESEAMIGSTITPITSPGASALKPPSPGTTRCNSGVRKVSAK